MRTDNLHTKEQSVATPFEKLFNERFQQGLGELSNLYNKIYATHPENKKGFEQLFSSDKWNIVAYKKYGTLDAFTLWWLGKMEKDKIDWSSKMENRFW